MSSHIPIGADVQEYLDAGLGGGGFPSVTVELSAANILDLGTTAVELVEAPGTDKVIVPVNLSLAYFFGTTAYEGEATLRLYYGTTQLATISNGLDTLIAEQDSWLVVGFEKVFIEDAADAVDAPVNVKLSGSLAGGAIVGQGVAGVNGLNAGGADYVIGDTGYVSFANNDARYVIDTVNGGGAVLTYHLVDGGSGYLVDTGLDTVGDGDQPGIGTGFTLDVDEVTQGDGTAKLTLRYAVEDIA